jgi:hypothetical protein
MNSYYVSSDAVIEIQSLFRGYMYKGGVESFDETGGKKMRDKMFNFFESKPFLDSYFKLAIDVADNLGVKNDDLVLQIQPTPRVFRPGDHGTSFHCDYWYGHGSSAYTIWTPLTEIEKGNTFYLIDKDKNEPYFESLTQANGCVEIEDELMINSLPALPLKGQSVVFNSKIIHGSPKNTSSKERISFDFRISSKSDETSTKDLANYFYFDGVEFKRPLSRFGKDKYIKYICGGEDKNTAAQHMAIESVAKFYSINIEAQEAEVERFGNVVFAQYLDGVAKAKGFQGIVLASRSLLSPGAIERAKKSDIKVYCVLENLFL